MSFPDETYASGGEYLAAYRRTLIEAWRSVDEAETSRAAELLATAISTGRTIYACGNGGSAAIANHLLCAFLKGVQTDTGLRPRIVSLASHLELITAIANDYAYEQVFDFQLKTIAQPGDVLITISGSGNSPNVVRAVEMAREHGVGAIAMIGFDGGAMAKLADVNLHVRAANYGIVEDVHQSLMHILAQYLRLRAMPPDLVPQRRF